MANSHDGFLSLLEQGKVATGAALGEWLATDSDEIEGAAAYFDKWSSGLEDAAEFAIDLLAADVTSDRELLIRLATEAERVSPEDDPKLAALANQLAEIAVEAEAEGIGVERTRDIRKVLIFSYFTDSVD